MSETPDTLRALATEATPGPWRDCGHGRGGCVCGLIWSVPVDVPIASVSDDDENGPCPPPEQRKRNAAYIAAASPDAVLALLDERDTLRAEVARLTTERSEDSARLDWLDTTGEVMDGPRASFPAWLLFHGPGSRNLTATVREAIDDEMRADRKEVL